MKNAQSLSENLTIIKKLLEIKTPTFEDGCSGVEVETNTYYLYAYDWFDGKTFEYYLGEKENGNYIQISLSEIEQQYIKNSLWEVFTAEKEDENIEDDFSSWNRELDMNPHFSNYLTGY